MAPKENIIATLGPASKDLETIRQLRLAGANFFRLNFSHGSHEDHKEFVKKIRQIDQEEGICTYILADLQGPKLRIGTFKDEKITLKEDMEFKFDLDPSPGNQSRVCLPHKEIIDALEVKSKILMDDGRVCMEIIKKGKDFVKAKVLSGTELSNNKGVNVPDVYLPMTSLTNKDRADLCIALDIGVDYIALSFVQRAADVKEAKDLIAGPSSSAAGKAATSKIDKQNETDSPKNVLNNAAFKKPKLIAKIEKPQALHNFRAIMKEADGVMVARGDLGVEIPFEYVPGVQREIIRQANEAGKLVIVATQMLDSMIKHPIPTRAEVNDVSDAVLKGADAVMLSGETAIGKYPLKAVKVMHKIYETALLELKNRKWFLSAVFRKAKNDPKATVDTTETETTDTLTKKAPKPTPKPK